MATGTGKASSLRWMILRRALLPRSQSSNDEEHQMAMKCISRRTMQGFNLIPSHHMVDDNESSGFATICNTSDDRGDARVCYTLPIDRAPKLYLRQRVNSSADLKDFKICNRYDIDNTGIEEGFSEIGKIGVTQADSKYCVSLDRKTIMRFLLQEVYPNVFFKLSGQEGSWPSEEVLAYFCLSHADLFRSKRVIELGSGYGLAGLVIAASSEALEVIISDGNPQVVDYIQQNIDDNSEAFGDTIMKSMTLHWNQDLSNILDCFDVIVASDCTFFEEFHKGLARTVKSLLKKAEPSEAIFFSPRRGDSLEKFLDEAKDSGLQCHVMEYYDAEVWKLHEKLMNDGNLWPGYEKDHCYPLLVKITL